MLLPLCRLDDGLPGCQVFGLVPEGSGILHQHVAQRSIAAFFRLVADGVFFAGVFGFDDDVGHGGCESLQT